MPPTSGRGIMSSDGGTQGASRHNPYAQQQQSQTSYQQQHVRISPGGATSNHGSRGNVTGSGSLHRIQEEEHISRTIQQTPLFERLVTEEVQELKSYARIIENQNRRLEELDRIHGDLECRLEQESRGRQQLEATLEKRERQWSDKFKKLESDRDHWKQVVEIEKNKNSRLIDQVVRKDQDIHRMLQRKYDHQRDNTHSHSFRSNIRPQHAGQERSQSHSRSPDYRLDQHRSPHEILRDSGDIESVRIRNVTNLLFEFFSM